MMMTTMTLTVGADSSSVCSNSFFFTRSCNSLSHTDIYGHNHFPENGKKRKKNELIIRRPDDIFALFLYDCD